MLGFPATECVVFEDVPAGVKAGKASGAKVIAFTSTVEASALREAGADWVLRNCSEVRASNNNKDLILTLS